MNDLLDTDLPDLPAVRELLARATADLEPPTGLDATARRRGRRLRVRRRALLASVGVAAAAAVATAAVPLAGGNGAAQVATQPSVTASPTTDSSPSPFVDKPGWWDRPAASMAKVLRGLLPAGVTVASFQTTAAPGDIAPDGGPRVTGELTGTLAGPLGPGAFEVQLRQLPDGDWDRAIRAAGEIMQPPTSGPATPPESIAGRVNDPALAQVVASEFTCPGNLDAPDMTCNLVRDVATGETTARVAELRHDGVIDREVRLRVGAGELYLAVANVTGQKWRGPATAAEPPLTIHQLQAIAENASWVAWTPKH